jgi:hypothetical protein
MKRFNRLPHPLGVDSLPVCGGHALRAEGMPMFVLDSKGQAWSVGIHGGKLYKTQSRQLADV